MHRRNAIWLVILIFLLFFMLAPVIDSVNLSDVVFQYDCPPGIRGGLPLLPIVSISYAVFRVGMIYDVQLSPPFAFEIGSTIHLPCNA